MIEPFTLADAPRPRLLPTDMSQFVRLDQCSRYLRLHLFERRSRPPSSALMAWRLYPSPTPHQIRPEGQPQCIPLGIQHLQRERRDVRPRTALEEPARCDMHHAALDRYYRAEACRNMGNLPNGARGVHGPASNVPEASLPPHERSPATRNPNRTSIEMLAHHGQNNERESVRNTGPY